MQYEAVIGLEVHAQLLTSTKIFCSCPNRFTPDNNVNTCPVCSAMPGVLPVLNEEAVRLAVLMGHATGCTIRQDSIFARKNYFYPDLPKAYQISQYDKPICANGSIEIETAATGNRTVRLNRIHLEEDAGKSIHDRSDTETLVDYNRCGTPLIEIVTEPDIRTPAEAAAYLTKIRQLVRYLDVCDGNMEEGSLRCDANVSIRPVGAERLGVKTELKNMNSIKQVEKAIQYEIDRQTDIVSSGGKIIQQTLLWDADTGETRPMRSKEDAHDYRYFPDPDLMPVAISDEFIRDVCKTLPELPDARRTRFINEYGLPSYDASVLTEDRATADYYENVVKAHNNSKSASNWMMTEVLRLAGQIKFPPDYLASLIKMIDDGVINGKIAKTVFENMASTGDAPANIVKANGLVQVTDTGEIEEMLAKIVASSPSQIAEYKAGKKKVLGYFVGEAMKISKGKANPKIVNEILEKLLTAN